MTATVVWDATCGFNIKLTQQQTAHNHALGIESCGNHPANRRVEDEHIIDLVDELQAAGAKNKLILQSLKKKTGKPVTLGDVRNLVAKPKEAWRGSTSVEKRLKAGLREFFTRKVNTATIYVDDDTLAHT
ncbi:hypothetical protein PI126_g17681 [Phytophthora idaei]|nr:hypothetical protein PI126_g17681 [Phytophthora idaei]